MGIGINAAQIAGADKAVVQNILHDFVRDALLGRTPEDWDVTTASHPEETMALLEEYRQWQEAQRQELGEKWEESPYVFPGERGGRMNPSQLGNWLVRFQKRHGLPHLNPHAFRHTMTSMLFFHGVYSVSISHRLGHSSVSTTTSIYSHVMQQAESRISDCMADVLLTTRESAQEDAGEAPKEPEEKP